MGRIILRNIFSASKHVLLFMVNWRINWIILMIVDCNLEFFVFSFIENIADCKAKNLRNCVLGQFTLNCLKLIIFMVCIIPYNLYVIEM